MNDSRIALKVGFFVATGLALLAVLVLSFSRGLTLFEHTDKLRIVFPSAAGLKPTADVMMSGVPIGKATSLELTNGGRSVAVSVSILSQYKIGAHAVFEVESLGFLGDQYISVKPWTNLDTTFWKDGDQVQGEGPFNMLEAERSVAGLLEEAKTTVSGIGQAVSNLNATVLSDQSLNDLDQTVRNLEGMATSALQTAQDAEVLVHSNTPAINEVVTNLLSFSGTLNSVASDLGRIVETNRPEVSKTIDNLRDTSASLKHVANDLEAGKGLVGGLLRDDEMKAQAASLLSNANAATAAFSAFGSNLNQKGVWRMLWKPKKTERSDKSPAPER